MPRVTRKKQKTSPSDPAVIAQLERMLASFGLGGEPPADAGSGTLRVVANSEAYAAQWYVVRDVLEGLWYEDVVKQVQTKTTACCPECRHSKELLISLHDALVTMPLPHQSCTAGACACVWVAADRVAG